MRAKDTVTRILLAGGLLLMETVFRFVSGLAVGKMQKAYKAENK